MPAYIEALEDTFDYNTDWQESIGDTGPGNAHLSQDQQEATLVGLVPANKKRSATRYFVGFAYADTAAPWSLHRENPQPHPEFPWMRAYDISWTQFVPLPQPSNVVPNPDTPLKIVSPFFPGVFYSSYAMAVATVRYRNWRCDFLEDSAIGDGDEWTRNTFIDPSPKIETLSVDGVGQLHFSETSTPAPTPGPPPTGGPPLVMGKGPPFPAPLVELKQTCSFVVNWLNVPLEFISTSEFYPYPKKILNCLGRVNNADQFLDGFFKETMLLEGIGITSKVFPVANATPQFALRSVDLQLQFTNFNPALGAMTPVLNGWQVMPWRGDGLWYGAVRDNNKPYLQEADYSQIFTHVDAP